MPYETSQITRLTEAVEGHDDLVRAALADGHIDAHEAARIRASSAALVTLMCWFGAILQVGLWVIHAGRPPREWLRKHPGWAFDAADLPPAAD